MKEDRLEDLLRAMDHPEEYTEEALQQLFSNEENRECYELAVKAREGFLQRSTRGGGNTVQTGTDVLDRAERFKLLKFAAIIIGVLMLSGITLAAIYIVQSPRQQTEVAGTTEQANPSQPAPHASSVKTDSVRTFEDVELEQILQEAADHYHVSVEYHSEQVRHIRLYTKWNPAAPLSELIDRLNGFEKVSIRQEGNLVTAE